MGNLPPAMPPPPPCMQCRTKGDNFLTCDQELSGDNVLSVAYAPAQGRLWVAWESGAGPTWRPAACSDYVEVDLKGKWW
jgi:hypothetical protein